MFRVHFEIGRSCRFFATSISIALTVAPVSINAYVLYIFDIPSEHRLGEVWIVTGIIMDFRYGSSFLIVIAPPYFSQSS